ncbi:MAG: hypothetical protein JO165_01765, partial [Candidatus Eremiobacteraeota bacterium]|nr:hypothetical protein [Candidatus Eremiobacteraeota bacterium]
MDSTRCKGSRTLNDPRIAAIPDVHGHAKGEHKPYAEERPIAYSPRMLFLWFYHACRRGAPRFMMVSDHINYLTFEDPGAVNTVRRALKLAEAGDLYGAAETAGVDVAHAAVVSEGLRRGMRFAIGAELDNDPRARPDAQNIVDAMRPDGMIRSVHFLTIDHPEKGADWPWPFDNVDFKELFEVVGTDRVWELYTTKLFDDIEKLPGHIVGHFYVPAKFGHWPDASKLEAYEDRLVELCAQRGLAIEINMRVFYREPEGDHRRLRDSYVRLMRKAKAKNVLLAIGADAHSPKDQSNGFDVALQMLDQAEINELAFPVAGRLARVALRATKEDLEKAKAQEPTPVQPGSSISGFGRAELGLPERDEAEERAARAAEEALTPSKLGRDSGPKRRASSPSRETKKRGKAKAEPPETVIPEGPGPEVATSKTRAEAEGLPVESSAKTPRTTRSRTASTSKKQAAVAPKPEPKSVKTVKSAKTAKTAAKAPVSKKSPVKTVAKVASKAISKTVKTIKSAAKKLTGAK